LDTGDEKKVSICRPYVRWGEGYFYLSGEVLLQLYICLYCLSDMRYSYGNEQRDISRTSPGVKPTIA
jgi:hypothetical protein